jgi:hypothetical protein
MRVPGGQPLLVRRPDRPDLGQRRGQVLRVLVQLQQGQRPAQAAGEGVRMTGPHQLDELLVGAVEQLGRLRRTADGAQRDGQVDPGVEGQP